MSVSDHYCRKFGSFERFNRVLYGGHAHDGGAGKFFTFAGDTPVFLGACSDYMKNTWCYQAKNGTLMSGLAVTPGHVEGGGRCDLFSQWFHDSQDILTRWHHGYLSYELTRFSSYFPDARVKIQVYPLNPDDGFLVHYDITTDQRVLFCAGFGGMTDFFGRFEYHTSTRKDFSAEDCRDNQAELEKEYACIRGPQNLSMWLAADFACSLSLDAPAAMEERFPSMFLTKHEGPAQIVKLVRPLEAGEHFTGNILLVQNGSPELLRKYLQMPDVCAFLRARCREKYASVTLSTPDRLLNDTLADVMIAQDASFQNNTFYHGAVGYHAPFLGWRGWYGPALLGWTDRVKSAIRAHFATILRSEGKEEKVWWDGGPRPDLDHEGTQYHHLENTRGRLTALLFMDDIYDMQEVAVDMTLYYLELSGDLELAAEIYDRLCEILDWEERILDPKGTGLYQNFLNTWISDGHCYNGAGCAQASAYNYAANARTAALGRRLGKDTAGLEQRAEKIRKAFAAKIWLEKEGIPAESVDTLGNRLVHPSPELSTIYLAADCGLTDRIQTWRMLNWTERNIPAVKTAGRGGKIYFSSNWRPKKYSTYGLFPAENACLALTYFQNGQAGKAMEILTGLLDAYLLSPAPGSITHVVTALGGTDDGDVDFTDVSSCYIRLLVEGLWGIRFRRSAGEIRICPQLPEDWKQASLSLPDLLADLSREELADHLSLQTDGEAEKIIVLPMRFAAVDQIFVNGREAEYRITAGIGRNFAEIRVRDSGRINLALYYRQEDYPVLSAPVLDTFAGNTELLSVSAGTVEEFTDFAGVAVSAVKNGRTLKLKIAGKPGTYDGLVRVRNQGGEYLLPVTLRIQPDITVEDPGDFPVCETVDLSRCFNYALTEIHNQEFRSPRPENYSIGMRLNGRYAWEWNQYGHNALHPDDSLLRNAGGEIRSASGIPFKTPAAGKNCLAVSMWEQFPTKAEIPLSGQGDELAVLLCGTTHAMQSYVVNGRLTVRYQDGTAETAELIPPLNFDDFLISAFQQQNESVYFSDGTHGMVQKIRLDPAKPLKSLEVEAVANEVIVDILGVTLRKKADD